MLDLLEYEIRKQNKLLQQILDKGGLGIIIEDLEPVRPDKVYMLGTIELRDILDSWDVKGFHDRNALNNRIIHYSRELQGCIERQGALERGWHCDDF